MENVHAFFNHLRIFAKSSAELPLPTGTMLDLCIVASPTIYSPEYSCILRLPATGTILSDVEIDGHFDE